MVNFTDITEAQALIAPYIKQTPVFSSRLLNQYLGHEIFFKAECLQKTGAFKLRGAAHFLARLKQNNSLPKHIVANSSGNHAQAVAYAGSLFNIPVTIYSAKNISPIKAAATMSYGATLKRFETRLEADHAVAEAGAKNDTVWIPPFNHPYVIAGQGTASLEALTQTHNINMIAAPCGGGGLLSGAIVVAQHLDENMHVVGAEPLAANDAVRSIREGRIVALDKAPLTLADGAATPSIGEHTFEILQSINEFYEIDEPDIIYWTQWLQHLLKLHIEPTCAMTMQAVVNYLAKQNKKKRVMVMISGGNISQTSMAKIWQYDALSTLPSLALAKDF